MVFKLSTDEKLLPLWMFLPIFLVLAACSDNSEDIDRYYATVSTPKVTTTTPTSLTVTASVTGDLNQIVKKGFCYSAAASVPTIKDHVVDADENFSASLSTLTSVPPTISVHTSTVTAVMSIQRWSRPPQKA